MNSINHINHWKHRKQLNYNLNSCSIRAGVCHPCVETKLTATEKSATDSN